MSFLSGWRTRKGFERAQAGIPKGLSFARLTFWQRFVAGCKRFSSWMSPSKPSSSINIKKP